MRKTVFSGAAALSVTTVFLVAPLAYAAPNSVTLAPSQAAPGGVVAVRATCDKKDVLLRSDVLEETVLKGQPAELRGSTKVKKAAKPGTYTASIKCGRATVKAKFTVVGAAAANQPGEDDVANTAALLPSSSPGVGTFVLGGVALLATAGAGFFALRQLRKEN
jgi:hypothetical protein